MASRADDRGTPGTLPPEEWRRTVRLGSAIALVYLAAVPISIWGVDGNSMLAVAESIVLRGSVAVPPNLGMVGVDGQVYSSWYPLLSVLAIPFVAVGHLLGRAFGVSGHFAAGLAGLVLVALLSAAVAALVHPLALRLGAGRRGAVTATLAYAFGTIALVYTRSFFAEPLLALLVSAGLLGAFRGGRLGLGVATTAAGLAFLAKPTGIVLAPVLSAYLLARRRSPALAALPLLGAAVGVAVYGVYNQVRFGHPLVFGPPWGWFSLRTIPESIAGMLMSPWRGLVWYSPVAILGFVALRRSPAERRLEALAAVGVFAALLGLHSLWTVWDAGWSWGPRFLLPAFPGLLALAGTGGVRVRRAMVALAVAGFVVSSPTLVSHYQRYYMEALPRAVPARTMQWSPAHAPAVRVWGTAARQVDAAIRSDVRELVREAPASGTDGRLPTSLRMIPLWWWILPAVGIPRWVGAMMAAISLACGAWLLAREWAAVRRGEGAGGRRGGPAKGERQD